MMTTIRTVSVLPLLLLVLFRPCRAEDIPVRWEDRTVADGVVYHEFLGVEPVSGDHQFVHVVEIDPGKGYRLAVDYDADSPHVASEIHRKHNAIVTINAGYEGEAIFIKSAGRVMRDIQCDTIPTPGHVPNWKNDGALCLSPDGIPVILNTMLWPEAGVSAYGLAVSIQREFFRNNPCLDAFPDIISSAPLLIDDYNPVGESFVSVPPEVFTSLEYENPQRHQGVRHPRTAVALKADGHILLIVVDGRQKGICEGFSAKELTRFLAVNFNPQYALNLDGGGSSTMCIRGLGHPATHVVNYPSDNRSADHDGERALLSFIFVTGAD